MAVNTACMCVCFNCMGFIYLLCLLYYLHQVNGVNGRDTILFSFDVCLYVCAQQTSQSDQFKMVKTTDFKFDVHVSRDSLDITL